MLHILDANILIDANRDYYPMDRVPEFWEWLLAEPVDAMLVRRVITAGYAPDLNDIEIEKLNEDPFLIAYALADRENRRVVSNETSGRRRRRANRKIPDVCDTFNVRHCNTFRFICDMNFRTDWRRQPAVEPAGRP